VASVRRVALSVAAAAVLVGGGGAAVVAYRSADPPEARPTPSATSATPVPTLPSHAVRTPAALAATPAAGPVADPQAVARTLSARLADSALGPRVNALVVDAATGATLYDSNAALPTIPASTTKVFTAAAALEALGPEHRLTTTIVSQAPPENGVLDGDLIVVGGGDPTLTNDPTPESYPKPATLASLVRLVRKAGVRKVTGDLVVDATLFDGPGLAPGWKLTYVSEGSVAPIRAFMVDGGRVRIDDDARNAEPDLAGAVKLRNALRDAGITIGDTLRRGAAPPQATTLAQVTSPTVASLVERMLTRSDNELAESLARHVALARGASADFAGVASAVPATVRDLGADPPSLHDGSGLSRLNRVTPAQLVGVLSVAVREARLGAVLTGLPVAAFSGTLSTRYDTAPSSTAAGRVRAKTGSLDNVATLAGVVETRSGRLLVFAFTADRLPTKYVGAAGRALDAAAAALAACGCR
jgi:D-alanyl-D-alanine carboxypeptidase/D-alanyl-D-alanine-endopeptidase (penicillin-binding protein 4)